MDADKPGIAPMNIPPSVPAISAMITSGWLSIAAPCAIKLNISPYLLYFSSGT